MISVTDLSRFFGNLKAVDAVSFTIGPGEVVGLLGHNGAGKSTMMKMLTGYLEPSEGRIQVGDLEMGPDTRTIQRQIGYLPENCPVWPEMTVIDYLEHEATLQGVEPVHRSQVVAEAIRRTELGEKGRDRIETLSRGFRQRVGVARAILHQPEIIILDEPTNGLDPTQIHQIRNLIGELAQSSTVILSTHILQEVQAVCERVLIMRQGKLVVDSRLDALRKASQLSLTVDSGDLKTHLATVKGIEKIERVHEQEGRYQYRMEGDPELAPQVLAILHQAGVQVYSLHPEARTLESVFAEVSAGSEPLLPLRINGKPP